MGRLKFHLTLYLDDMIFAKSKDTERIDHCKEYIDFSVTESGLFHKYLKMIRQSCQIQKFWE